MAEHHDNTTVPYMPSDADLQRRLINFNTGKHDLLTGHQLWLTDLLTATPATREFHCHIYGYASKLGSTAKNQALAYDRANAVAKFLESRNPRYTTRIETFRSFGEEDPNYVAGESDNDGRWRAVEVHVKFDRAPIVKPGVRKMPGPRTKTNMRWSVCGYFSLMSSIFYIAQFGISLFKFRDDETGAVRTYISPMTGIGGGFDVTKLRGLLKAIADKKIPLPAHIAVAVDKVLKNPALLMSPYAALREIGKAIATGGGVQDWTDFTKCDVYQPLTHQKRDGKDIANASITGGLYQGQKIFVSGKVWYAEPSGKKMFGTRDLLAASSASWVAQVPAIAMGAVGGPLLML